MSNRSKTKKFIQQTVAKREACPNTYSTYDKILINNKDFKSNVSIVSPNPLGKVCI